MIQFEQLFKEDQVPNSIDADTNGQLYKFFIRYERHRPDIGPKVYQEYIVYYKDGTHYDDSPVFRFYKRETDDANLMSADFWREVKGSREYEAYRDMWLKQGFEPLNIKGEIIDPKDPFDEGDHCVPLRFAHCAPSFPF